MAEILMPFALSAGGELARAETAPRGEPYSCLDCGARLKLRRGDMRAPHFAHTLPSTCTGEGVLHKAAKLELWRALQERERPFMLDVPCAWPGCTNTVPMRFDGRLGGFKDVMLEYPLADALTERGAPYVADVVTLLHGQVQVAFEVYHHHRVDDAKAHALGFGWLEVHALPLLDDPYHLVMVKNERPVSPKIEDARLDPQVITALDLAEVHALRQYRAQGSGRFIEEHHGEVTIDDFRYYNCFEHTAELERLEDLGWQHWYHTLHGQPADHDAPGQDLTESPPEAKPLPGELQVALEQLGRAGVFAASYYQHLNVPLRALAGLQLKACRCPHCAKRAVFSLSTFTPHLSELRGLLFLSRDEQGRSVAVNTCGRCHQTVNRRMIQQANGVSLPGDLLAALTHSQT